MWRVCYKLALGDRRRLRRTRHGSLADSAGRCHRVPMTEIGNRCEFHRCSGRITRRTITRRDLWSLNWKQVKQSSAARSPPTIQTPLSGSPSRAGCRAQRYRRWARTCNLTVNPDTHRDSLYRPGRLVRIDTADLRYLIKRSPRIAPARVSNSSNQTYVQGPPLAVYFDPFRSGSLCSATRRPRSSERPTYNRPRGF